MMLSPLYYIVNYVLNYPLSVIFTFLVVNLEINGVQNITVYHLLFIKRMSICLKERYVS